MSLKTFHIFFISISVLLAFGFGVWSYIAYSNAGNVINLIGAILSVVFGVGLIFYGSWFLRKMKKDID